MAIGRTADLNSLGLEPLGVQIDKNKKIITNEKWQTKANNIYAIGDVRSNGLELTPVAIKEGEYLVNGLFKNQWKTLDYTLVPTTVFTPLEYSKCGLSEEEAIQIYGEDNIEVYHQSFTPLEWNLNYEREKGECYCKVIVNQANQKVLGIHYLGPNAGEIMQGYAVAMRMHITYQDLMETIGIHPTCSEEIVKSKPTKREEENPEAHGC